MRLDPLEVGGSVLMRNADVVGKWPQLERLRRQLRRAKSAAERLKEQADKLEGVVEALDRVTSVVDGVALCETRERGFSGFRSYYVMAAADSNERGAMVYTAAGTGASRSSKNCGLTIYGGLLSARSEEWCGVGHRYADAVRMAQAWVTRGANPNRRREPSTKSHETRRKS